MIVISLQWIVFYYICCVFYYQCLIDRTFHILNRELLPLSEIRQIWKAAELQKMLLRNPRSQNQPIEKSLRRLITVFFRLRKVVLKLQAKLKDKLQKFAPLQLFQTLCQQRVIRCHHFQV